MPPRRKVTTFNKARAIAWLQDSVSKREVGRRLGVSHSVVVRLHQKFQATNSVLERPRSGRPKKTTQREDSGFIRRQALQQRGTTANIIRGQRRVATNTNVSTKTIRKRLHEVGLRSRRQSSCTATTDSSSSPGSFGVLSQPCQVDTPAMGRCAVQR
ncbi:hypothetical protein V1264_000017 [Littorina saxatilis]|uniref:Transposase Tc1-like domain-containing protein n=1 Tax=Littorina saxatilis TaxID=31220 RepID=A0AAN9GP89_9CAEN